MNELIQQYKETRRALSRLRPDDKEHESRINSYISNLTYSITWMELGYKPGPSRGIERRAGYDREIPVGDGIYRYSAVTVKREYDAKARERIEIALRVLSDREREAYELLYGGEGFSFTEVADIMGVSRSTVQTLIRRAECKLKLTINQSYLTLESHA